MKGCTFHLSQSFRRGRGMPNQDLWREDDFPGGKRISILDPVKQQPGGGLAQNYSELSKSFGLIFTACRAGI